ncbi:MAG TPA: pyridoxamine 5'-phosphate oxidase family protein [Rubrobacter sp.]|nr:pyridoxamine 5'-phosphate oxidase family protein [Rubrobacter sp.]
MDQRGERSCGKQDLGALARSIVDSKLYATLATADAEGRPWASPVWFAHDGYRDFFWVSRPEARHSRNVAARASARGLRFDGGAGGCRRRLRGGTRRRARGP